MRLQGPTRRITIFIGESDRFHHKPLYAEIVQRASRLLSLSEDLPLAIIIVDTAERTDEFLEEVADLVTGGLIIVDDVHVHTYAGGQPGGGRS